MNNSFQYSLNIGYNDKYIKESVHTKFLGLQIDIRLNWKCHIDQLVSKLSAACHAVRSTLHISNTGTLKSIHFASIHYTMKNGKIFWVNSSNSKTIFMLQMKIRVDVYLKICDLTSSTWMHIFVNELHCK
jgi:glycine cleavage system regulatory protein